MTPAGPLPKISEERARSCGWGTAAKRNAEYVPYPWDEWKAWAIANGAPEELAGIGRAVIREAYQHDWDDRLKALCGWRDDGQAMLTAALKSPDEARRSWKKLLATDGLRVVDQGASS